MHELAVCFMGTTLKLAQYVLYIRLDKIRDQSSDRSVFRSIRTGMPRNDDLIFSASPSGEVPKWVVTGPTRTRFGSKKLPLGFESHPLRQKYLGIRTPNGRMKDIQFLFGILILILSWRGGRAAGNGTTGMWGGKFRGVDPTHSPQKLKLNDSSAQLSISLHCGHANGEVAFCLYSQPL